MEDESEGDAALNPHESDSDEPDEWHVCTPLGSPWVPQTCQGPRSKRCKTFGRTLRQWQSEMASKEEMEQVSESDQEDVPLHWNLPSL